MTGLVVYLISALVVTLVSAWLVFEEYSYPSEDEKIYKRIASIFFLTALVWPITGLCVLVWLVFKTANRAFRVAIGEDDDAR